MPYSDAKLAQMANRREELKREANDLKARIALIDGKIIGEMDRRGTRTMETHGVKITVTAAETTKYNFDGLSEDLTPRMLRKVQKKEVDKTLLAQAVQSGTIDAALAARHSEVTVAAPYINVSPA